MQVSPEISPFSKTYADGAPQVVWTTLVADLETPVSAMMKLAERRANAFLLESVEGGSVRGRFSIIGLRPDVIWRFKKNQAEINRQARIDPHAFEPCAEDPQASFRSLLAESEIELPENLPPMASGLFGYMGYDAVRL
ncbi:MAG: anthranilate synthase component I, partial [Nisaea sp.]